jgi:hypothetical protein
MEAISQSKMSKITYMAFLHQMHQRPYFSQAGNEVFPSKAQGIRDNHYEAHFLLVASLTKIKQSFGVFYVLIKIIKSEVIKLNSDCFFEILKFQKKC